MSRIARECDIISVESNYLVLLPTIFSFGVFGEPPLFYPLFLFEHLFDGPERGEGKYAGQSREHDVGGKQ